MENIEQRYKAVSDSKTFKNLIGIFDLDKKRILDIGCSYGEHLIHFGKGSVGITINKGEADYTNSRGLSIIRANIENQDLILNEKFDAVFANNIIEHLFSPHNFLMKIKEFLRKDGVLILGTPVTPKISFLLRFKKLRGALGVSHLNFFTQETILKTVERAGWTIQNIRTFRFRNGMFDKFLNPISPHFYIIASPDFNFRYPEKKIKELE